MHNDEKTLIPISTKSADADIIGILNIVMAPYIGFNAKMYFKNGILSP